MYKLPITYKTFEGEERTRDFYFNLTKGEIMKIHLSLPGGFDGFLERLKDEPDVNDVMNVFEKLILTSYGKRMPDGKYVKSKELSDEFSATDAYSELLIKFIDNEDDFANKFLEGALGVSLTEIQNMIDENPDLKAVSDKMVVSEF